MNRRSVVIALVIVVVAAGGYYLTHWQQLRKTTELLKALAGEDDKDAAAAMEQLSVRGVRLYPRLIELARSAQPVARWRVAVMLGELGNPAATEVLRGMLSDSEATVRAAAAQALGRIGAEQAAGALAELVAAESEELTVRISAARGLALLAAEEAVPQLTQALVYQPVVEEDATDDSWQLRIEAARALGAIGAAEAIVEARRAGSPAESDARVRTAIAYAVGDALSNNAADSRGFDVGLGVLLRAARDEVGDVRVAAIDALGRISPPAHLESRAEQVVEQAQRDPHYWVRQAGAGGS